MTTHSPKSPSGWARMARCSASYALQRWAPPEAPSKYAAEGTALHEAHADVVAGRSSKCLTAPQQELVAAVVAAFDDRRGQLAYSVELRLDLSDALGGGESGTADFVILDAPAKTLVIADAKYGVARVEVEGNAQLMLYAYGALQAYDFACNWEHVEMHIWQPRCDNFSSTTTTVAELLAWVDAQREISKALDALAAATHKPSDVPADAFSIGEHCRYCKALAVCAAYHAKARARLKRAAGAKKMTPSDLEEAYEDAILLSAWADGVKTAMVQHLASGGVSAKWKLVAGRAGASKYYDPDKVLAHVQAGLMPKMLLAPPTLRTPIQAMAAGWQPSPQEEKELTYRAQCSPSIVPVGDKRPALVSGTLVSNFFDHEN